MCGVGVRVSLHWAYNRLVQCQHLNARAVAHRKLAVHRNPWTLCSTTLATVEGTFVPDVMTTSAPCYGPLRSVRWGACTLVQKQAC
eukprot:240216-Amphidinium_carterae.1